MRFPIWMALLALLVVVPGCATLKKWWFHAFRTPTGIECPVQSLTPPKTGTQKQLVFAVLGDFGSREEPQTRVAQAVTKLCKKHRCDFALGTGDNFYDVGVTSTQDEHFSAFEKTYGDWKWPWFNSLGNHDWYSGQVGARAQIQYSEKQKLFKLPCAYYSLGNHFPLPPWAHFYALDTFQFNDRQLLAAKNHLCKKPGWRILFGHHPRWSSGKHGETKSLKALENEVFGSCAQVYFSGHDHHLEYISTPNFDQIVSGGGGKDLGKLKKKNRHKHQKFASLSFGFFLVTLKPHEMKLEAYDEKGTRRYTALRRLDSYRSP